MSSLPIADARSFGVLHEQVSAVRERSLLSPENRLPLHTLPQVKRRRAARENAHPILKGETPAVLVLQAPSRHNLVLNLKTAMAMGLDVPVNVLSPADEVMNGPW
jgi:putative ABC transport system substrate-binding protein